MWQKCHVFFFETKNNTKTDLNQKKMKNLTKTQATSLVLDTSTYGIKTTCKKTKETFSSLRDRGYKTASELAELNVPTHYLFSEKEGRLFFCTSGGCTEILSAAVKRVGWVIF